MGSEIEIVEQRLKSFTGQLRTECVILGRLVYKHKNQHRRCAYFQYILKVRRDLKILDSANLDEIFDASFLVINGNRPKQKVQLLESLKRRKCGRGTFNFLERLLGVTRLLSQMVEPLLRAAMEISKLLARSFFMKFSLTILAVLARIRVLVQQTLLDAVLLYNTVTSLSQREQSIKLNQEGFEVFREYYPKKEEASIILECIWQNDKYLLVERTCKTESNREEDGQGDVSLNASKILYENIEAFLGVNISGTEVAGRSLVDPIDVEEDGTDRSLADPVNVEEGSSNSNSGTNNDEKHVENISDATGASSMNTVNAEDVFNDSSSVGVIVETNSIRSTEDGGSSFTEKRNVKRSSLESCFAASSSASNPVKFKNNTKKVAFVSVKPPASSTTNGSSNFHLKGTEKNSVDTEDSFFNLLTCGNKMSSLF